MIRALVTALCVATAAPVLADGFGPPPNPGVPLVVMFDDLSGLNVGVGTLAFVRDCRALTLAAGVLSLQAPPGSGCTASFNGSVWQIDGTTIPVVK